MFSIFFQSNLLMAEANFTAISLMEKRTSTQYYVLADLCLYAYYSKRGDVIFLKCIDDGCNCNGKISNGTFSRTNKLPHSHDDNHQEVANYLIAYERLRAMVKTDRRPVRELHQEVLGTLSRDCAAMLSWRHCHRTLERIRNELLPPCCSMMEMQNELDDEESFGFLSYGRIRGTKFYQGSVNGQLIFSNLELVAELTEEFEIYVDATFSVTPFHSRQLLVILGDLRGVPRPLIYAIMLGQTTAEYAAIFEFVRDSIFGYNGIIRVPIAAISDFEQAIRLALVQVWPHLEVYGCNFHLCQAQKRHARSIQTLNACLLVSEIHNKTLTMFTRLSLLPLNRIMQGFDSLLDYINENELRDDFRDFVEYFRRTWLVRYPINSWCVSARDRRTNNNLEGYNNRIKLQIPVHPKPWVFLDALRKLAIDASSEYDSDVLNNALPPIDRSLLTEPLNAALRQLLDGTIDEIHFLELMSMPHNR